MNGMVSGSRLRLLGWGAFVALHLALPRPSPLLARDALVDGEAVVEAWEALSGEGITVEYRRGDALYASRVRSIYRVRGPEIAGSMGLPGLAPLRVVIAPSDEEFAHEVSAGVPDWGVGCALPARGLIVLKSPRIVDYPLQMEAVVVHEMAHVATGRVLGRVEVPQWFDEGVAMAVAGEWRLDESPSLASAAAASELIPLSALERGFPNRTDAAALAYAESFQAVQFLMEETGIAAPGTLVRMIATEGDFDRTLNAIYGTTREQFEVDLFDFLGRRFRPGLILSGGRLLFSVATGLFLIAVAVRLRRSRRRMREWEDEERFRTRRRPPRATDTSWS